MTEAAPIKYNVTKISGLFSSSADVSGSDGSITRLEIQGIGRKNRLVAAYEHGTGALEGVLIFKGSTVIEGRTSRRGAYARAISELSQNPQGEGGPSLPGGVGKMFDERRYPTKAGAAAAIVRSFIR